MASSPTQTMRRYFETWKARRFDDFQALLADAVSFRGPMGSADDAASCRAGIEGMSQITTDIVICAMAAEGEDVVTMFELHTTQADAPLLVANWSKVNENGVITQIRAAFDPRPMLS